MSQHDYRVALIIEGDEPVDSVVIADGKEGDKTLKDNPTWVEVTGMDPMPGVGSGWFYVDGKWEPPAPYVPTREDVEHMRQAAYAEFSDPVFFEYQRGDATKQEWLDAVQAVKDAHPYPVED
jgi:hypothetical protein